MWDGEEKSEDFDLEYVSIIYPKLNTNIKFEGLVHSLDRVKLLWWGEGLGFQIFPCLP